MARQQSYAEQLGDTLRRRDPRLLQTFLVQNARRFGDARQVAEVEGKAPEEMTALMHRMILARADLKDLHPASRDWLAKHADGRG